MDRRDARSLPRSVWAVALAGNVSACSSSFTYKEVTPAASIPAPTPMPAAPKRKKCKKKGKAAASKKCKKK